MKRTTLGSGRAATDKGSRAFVPITYPFINYADIYGARPMPAVVKVDHRSPGDWADYLEKLSQEKSRREPH